MKIIGFVIALMLPISSALASEVSVSCREVRAAILQSTLEMGFVADACPSDEYCQPSDQADQKYDPLLPGKFIYTGPASRLKIISSSGEAGCPAAGTLFDLFLYVPVDQIAASLFCDMDLPSARGGMGCTFRQIMSAEGDVWSGAETAAGEKVSDCFPKGAAVGSGLPDACCDGLTVIYAVDAMTCEPLIGGYFCAACGDGVCEDPENHCNCPHDCNDGNEPKI